MNFQRTQEITASSTATTAKEITLTMKELNNALNGLDKAVPQLQRAGEPFERTADRLLIRLFLVGASLIVLLTVSAILVIVFYRRTAERQNRETPLTASLS